MTPGAKAYIGDGVYVALECGMLCLTTENGYETTNTIFLEAQVWRALKLWVEDLEKKLAAQEAPAVPEPDADLNRIEHDDKGDN